MRLRATGVRICDCTRRASLGVASPRTPLRVTVLGVMHAIPVGRRIAEAVRANRLRAPREEPAAFDATEDAVATIALEEFPKEVGFGGDAQESFVLGAYLPDDTLVGHVGGDRNDNLKRHHRALICGMYVAAEHRGRGIGRASLEETLTRMGAGRDSSRCGSATSCPTSPRVGSTRQASRRSG